MSKIIVYVLSKIPNLSKELQRTLPSVVFQDVKADDGALKKAEIIVGDFDLMIPHIYTLPNLKWLEGTWAGLDKIIPHMHQPPPFVITRFSGLRFGQIMAEYIIACIVNNERDFNNVRENQQKQIWSKEGKISNYRVISDLSIGIMGLGNIGKFVGQCLNSLGAKILGYGRKPPLNSSTDFYTKSTLPNFLKSCDYIINTLPSTPETKGLLNGNILKYCEERQSVFINVGRGSIISESDLISALDNGWVSGAILDVFEIEPLPKESRLWTMDQVQITPHVSADTKIKHVAEHFEANLQLYVENKPLLHQFSLQQGY